MERTFFVFALVIAAIDVQGLSLRHKRQSDTAVQNGCTGDDCTPRLLTIEECISACPVTSEYNPICGTDNMVYSNPGRLRCARECGVDVQMGRPAPCPSPSMPSTQVPAAITTSTIS